MTKALDAKEDKWERRVRMIGMRGMYTHEAAGNI